MDDVRPALAAAPSAEAVARLAERLLPGGAVRGFDRLSGGASMETWRLVLEAGGTEHLFILRRALGGVFQTPWASGLETEAAVIRAVGRLGVPVPAVHHVLIDPDGLGRGFVTGFVEGETLGRRILRDDRFAATRDTLARDFGTILARIHSAPLADLPPLKHEGVAATLATVASHVAALEEPHPVFALALKWLEARVPAEPAKPSLVHGDFRMGNVIIAPDGIRAVLDWELVHLGDPMRDLAWLCCTPWRFGMIDLPVGGVGLREDLHAGYQAAGGTLDRDRLLWWEMYGALRWGVTCATGVSRFRTGVDPTVERAMIARRSSESEIDILRLMRFGA
jgi:aminoglycoside phosphotransferase (APT) family kinase protein